VLVVPVSVLFVPSVIVLLVVTKVNVTGLETVTHFKINQSPSTMGLAVRELFTVIVRLLVFTRTMDPYKVLSNNKEVEGTIVRGDVYIPFTPFGPDAPLAPEGPEGPEGPEEPSDPSIPEGPEGPDGPLLP